MNARQKLKAQAREEGIVFQAYTDEPLFAKDIPRWREILATPAERTPAQIAEDEHE